MNKVTIIGSGCVGATIGYALSFYPQIDEIALVDVKKELSQGEAMDIFSGSCCIGNGKIKAGSYEDCSDSDILILTAGINRKPGQTRDDLLGTNESIMESVLENIKPKYNNSFVIIVTNPVDALTKYVANYGFIPKDKLCGTGCMLDTARWVAELSNYLNIASRRITAFAVGKHGSEQKLLWSMTRVDDTPIIEYCEKNNILMNSTVKEKLRKIVENQGAEIIKRKGKTQYGIASVCAVLVNALLQKQETLVSVGTMLGNKENNKVISKLVYIGNGKIRVAEEFVGIEE